MISAGQNVTYTYLVQNTGNVLLSQVKIQDLLGYTLLIGDLNSQQTYTATFFYPLTQTDLDTGTIHSQAQVTGQYMSQTLTSEQTMTLKLPQITSIYVSKRSAPIENGIHPLFLYTIEVTNLGNVTHTDLIISDPLLGLNQTLNLLMPFATHLEQVNYQPTSAEIADGIVFNTAMVSGLNPQNQPVGMSSEIASVPGLAKDTRITLQDGTERNIQDVQRGDWVKPGHRVARLCQHPIGLQQKINFLLFNRGSLGYGIPYRELLITGISNCFSTATASWRKFLIVFWVSVK